MTQDYYGTKRITAWSQERDGQTDMLADDWQIIE